MKEIKAAIGSGAFDEAIGLIEEMLGSEGSRPPPFKSLNYALHAIPDSSWERRGYVTKKIAILSGYAIQLLTSDLLISLLKRRIKPTLYVADFGLQEQIIASRDPQLKAFAPDLLFFHVGVDHLEFQNVSEEAERWLQLCQRAHDFLGCEIVFSNFESLKRRVFGNLDAKGATGRGAFVEHLNLEFAKRIPAYVHLNDVHHLASLVGTMNWREEKLYDLAKVPIAPNYWSAFTDNVAAVIGALYGRSRKCLVVDLDNTLWSGVIGDDGIAGIEIGEGSSAGEAFKRLQQYILELKNRGVILAVCSKNDHATALEPFEKHDGMVLRREDFGAFVANWEPKHENIVAIAKKLNIGLDAIVFLDDNPAEREIVARSLHQVRVIELGSDPSEYADLLARSNEFETVSITADDLKRAEQYARENERENLLSAAPTYTQYLDGLQMVGVAAPFDVVHLPRITQLINKTNQFNLTTKRYTEADVTSFAKSPETITRYVKLKDRFGDLGLISAFVGVERHQGILEVDTWVMSCRVLKRNVEHFLMKSVLESLDASRFKEVHGLYSPTAKNGLVKGLFKELGFELLNEKPDGSAVWKFDLSKHDSSPLIDAARVINEASKEA